MRPPLERDPKAAHDAFPMSKLPRPLDTTVTTLLPQHPPLIRQELTEQDWDPRLKVTTPKLKDSCGSDQRKTSNLRAG